MAVTGYLRFETADSASGKTRVVSVISVMHGDKLGEIRWFGRWRQYAFYPAPGSIWNPDCLNVIIAKIRELTGRARLMAVVIAVSAGMSTRRMFRYVVPVDDQPHEFPLTANPVAVATVPDATAVEFWAEHAEGAFPVVRAFRVFGTGQPLPDDARWRGTCPRVHGLVWHLYEVT